MTEPLVVEVLSSRIRRITCFRDEVDLYSAHARAAIAVGNEFKARRYARIALVAARDALAVAVGQ